MRSPVKPNTKITKFNKAAIVVFSLTTISFTSLANNQKTHTSALEPLTITEDTLTNIPDPLTSYIKDGNLVGYWQANLSNPLNWHIPVVNQHAKTEQGNLVVSPTTKATENDAINLKWQGNKEENQWGENSLHTTNFTIAKHQIDISAVENETALMIDIKINSPVEEETFFTMQCNNSNKCQGEFSAQAVLNELPKGQWVQLPIPLNCFNKDDKFDFSKVTSILSIGTEGKLDIDIANIELVALSAGNNGCKL